MRQHFAWLAVLAIALPSFTGAQPRSAQPKTGQSGKLYQWTDDKGELTPEQRAEKARLAAEAEQAKHQREELARRDKMLLETYISVADIEDLRNRRLEL